MSEQPFDPAAYKAGQRKQWDSVSGGWEKWWESFERGAQYASDRLVELAGVQAGHRVLDVATGIGEPAITAARRVGSNGHVFATDQAPEMLAIARRRAEKEGLSQVTFEEMDGEQLDLPEGSFDAAVCRWGLMFMPHINETLKRIHRALRHGARFATAVWDTPDKTPILSTPMGVLQQMFAPPPPPPDAPNLFKLAVPGLLEGAMEQAGFRDVATERITVTIGFASAEEFTAWIGDIAPPVIAMVGAAPKPRQQEAWQAITEAARAYAKPDGSVAMDNISIIVSGKRG